MSEFKPLFFKGAHGCRLYGVMHSAQTKPAPGILILPPLGQEAARVHKSLQKMATDLARKGYCVFRFDYAGSGNSEDPETLDLQSWITDATAALALLRTHCGSDDLNLIGIRLGGSVALMLDSNVNRVVLWDPIVDGSGYLRDLQALHKSVFSSGLYFRKPPRRRSRSNEELLGHWVPEAMQQSISQLRLTEQSRLSADDLMWLDAEPQREGAFEALESHLPGRVHHQEVKLACQWQSLEQLENMLLGQPAARAIERFVLSGGG